MRRATVDPIKISRPFIGLLALINNWLPGTINRTIDMRHIWSQWSHVLHIIL